MHSPSFECDKSSETFHVKTAKTSLLLFTFSNATFMIFGDSHL